MIQKISYELTNCISIPIFKTNILQFTNLKRIMNSEINIYISNNCIINVKRV